MVNHIKILSLILLISAIFGCQNVERKPLKKNEKNFGLFQNEDDSISVELKLSEFNSWNELLKRTEQIVCNDSLPKITIENDNLTKRVYLRNPCWEGFACLLIKQKNVIQIHNDTINKADKVFYPLDSLAQVLKRDIENDGKNPGLSDNPEKLLIHISYDKNGLKKLPNTLNRLTKAFEQATDRKDLKVWLNEKINIYPPPPPPKKNIIN